MGGLLHKVRKLLQRDPEAEGGWVHNPDPLRAQVSPPLISSYFPNPSRAIESPPPSLPFPREVFMLSPSSSLHFSSKRGEGVFIPRKDLSLRRSLASELSLRPPLAGF